MRPAGDRIAVLLMAYGAASSLEEIPAYLSDIMGGRPAPPAMVREVAERCRRIGGKSPLIDIVREQARALERLMGEDRVAAYVGMRHCEPTIASAVRRIVDAGHRRVAAIPLNPYRAAETDGAYLRKARLAVETMGAELEVLRPAPWHEHPLFIEALREKIAEARERVPEALRGGTVLLMTAHSLPERLLGKDEPYRGDLAATSRALAEAAGFSRWRFAFQSRPVRAPEPWIGPFAEDAIDELAAGGVKCVLLSPIGYLGENLETLYDDDIVFRGRAEALGLRFERAAAPNDSPAFIKALAEAASSALRAG